MTTMKKSSLLPSPSLCLHVFAVLVWMQTSPSSSQVAAAAASPVFLTTPLAFAAGGGFGSSSSSSKKVSKKKKGSTKTKPKHKSPNTSSSSSSSTSNSNRHPNLDTPEGRMEHIRQRIAASDVSSVAQLALTASSTDGQLVLDTNPNGMAVVDNFLGQELITAMRQEAEQLLPTMVPSQSTKWDEATQSVVPYEKFGVLSTQIEGGTLGYQASPRLVEYIVTLTQHLTAKLNPLLPEQHQLSNAAQTNKLAVCLGDGSYYDKHIDNLGGGGDGKDAVGDRRKLTALLYLQPPGSHDGQAAYPHERVEDDARGGYFRAFDVPDVDQVTCIAPRGDRLVLFWSDALVHDVSPSFAVTGTADRRWALTVWLMAAEHATIRQTAAAIEERHFGTG